MRVRRDARPLPAVHRRRHSARTVAMTRGRDANYAYVVNDRADDLHATPNPADDREATTRSVLFGVLQHVGAELTAHDTITAEQERWGSIAQLAAEYETLAAAAQHDRWAHLVYASPLTPEQADAVVDSDAFGALTAELRRAEANHHDVEALFPRLVAARDFDDADDIASVLHYRVARATTRPAGSGRRQRTSRLIVGLVPEARGITDTDMLAAMRERVALMEQRAMAVLEAALADSDSWASALGTEPSNPRAANEWRRAARTIAAYRDRYGVPDGLGLGSEPQNENQKIDLARARAAQDQAKRLATETPARASTPPRQPQGRTL